MRILFIIFFYSIFVVSKPKRIIIPQPKDIKKTYGYERAFLDYQGGYKNSKFDKSDLEVDISFLGLNVKELADLNKYLGMKVTLLIDGHIREVPQRNNHLYTFKLFCNKCGHKDNMFIDMLYHVVQNHCKKTE